MIDDVMVSGNGFGEITHAISQRILKIYWLIDVSKSMQGAKIAAVNRAIKAAIPMLISEAEEQPTIQTRVRAMKFSSNAVWHTNEAKIEDFEWYDLDVEGLTSTGAALKLMAEELTVEKMGKRAIPPVLILMSDGEATDDYDGGLNVLLQQKWSKKAIRVAIAVGDDANIDELTKFCSNPNELPPILVSNTNEFVKALIWASVDVSKSVSISEIGGSGSPQLPKLPDLDPQGGPIIIIDEGNGSDDEGDWEW